MDAEETANAATEDGGLRPFFYSIADLPAASISQMLDRTDSSEEDKQEMYHIFGRDLMTKVILQSPTLSVYHEEAKPGEQFRALRADAGEGDEGRRALSFGRCLCWHGELCH